jgi:hypothetical protein
MVDERLRKEDWEVRPVSIKIARELVKAFHYAKGASNTATYLHGLFPKDSIWESDCRGIAWWIPPTKDAAIKTFPQNWQGVLSLSRLVIVPDIPHNACSFLLSKSAKLIPKEVWPCLVTYADTAKGHTGAIYKACNWIYLGLTKKQPSYTINGIMTARKAGPKTRSHKQMLELGAVYEGQHAKHKFVLMR